MSDLIDVEDESTWPSECMAVLEETLTWLPGYQDGAVDPRICPEVERVNALLAEHSVICFHCTRLTQDEILEIGRSGLKLQTPELMDGRIERRVAAGDLSIATAQILKQSHHAGDEYRRNRIWFANTKSTLQDGGAVHRLFRSWGGEALYLGHEEGRSSASRELSAIGHPCIVVGALRAAEMGGANGTTFWSIGEQLLIGFLEQRGLRTIHRDPGQDVCLKQDLPGERIVRIVKYGDPEFEELTQSSKWMEFHRINDGVGDSKSSNSHRLQQG